MAELKGSKTEQNLWTAFAGESQARNKYTYFASKAKKDGYVQIAKIFEETAANEKEHAEIWFKLLNGIGTTAENLEAAAQGENYEWTEMYATMAKEAREEGFDHIAFQDREGARGPLPQAAGQCRGRAGVLPGWRDDLAVQQLRAHPCGQAGPGDVSCLCPSQGLFPAESGELLIETGPGAVKLPVFCLYSQNLYTER